MKHINVVLGLAVMAVLALSAFAVSSASAAAPELFRAGKPGSLVLGEIKGKSSGSTTLESKNGTKVTCEKAESKGGEATNTKEIAKTTVKFNGCKESLFGGKCNTAKLAAGEILTAELTGKIGFEPKSTTEVDLELKPAKTEDKEGGKEVLEGSNGAFAVFECTGGLAKIEARGAVIGMLGKGQLGKSTKSLNLLYEKGASAGLQELTSMEGGFMTEAKLESSLNGGKFEPSNQQGEATTEFKEAVELT
jgi:hypothetical protein